MKKILSLLLSLALIVSICCVPVFAIEEVQLLQTDVSYSQEMINGIRDIVVASIGNTDSSVSVANGIFFYNANSNIFSRLLPVFVGEECVAIVHISESGHYALSNDVSVFTAITCLNPGEYIIYVCGNTYYAESSNQVVVLGSTIFNETVNDTFLEKTYNEKEELIDSLCSGIMKSVSYAFEPLLSFRNDLSARAVVPLYEGEECKVTNFVQQGNYGLCWAACVATIVNYKQNLSLTAMNVADRCGIGYNEGADVNEMTIALSQYNLSYNAFAGKVAWNDVKESIKDFRPFIVAIAYGQSGHAIMPYGYSCAYSDPEASSQTRYMKVWEPNGTQMTIQYNSATVEFDGHPYVWNSYAI